MIVYLNGRFLPEENASLSIHDRGFLYGDGLFETLRVYRGAPFLWREHMERFMRGADCLRIAPPLSPGELSRVVQELIARNGQREAIVRITLSRGAGSRGYSPQGAALPTLLIALMPARKRMPKGFRVVTSLRRLHSSDPLAQFKHTNKLLQVVARAEADRANADETILLNEKGNVAEATGANIFWINRGALWTPPLTEGILGGITRAWVIALAREIGLQVREETTVPGKVKRADGVFLTSSGIEIMEVSHWDTLVMNRSPLVRELKTVYRARRRFSN